MTARILRLPTEEPSPSRSVGHEDGGPASERDAVLEVPKVASLPTRIEWMRFCSHCECERQFISGGFSLEGRIGCCLYCGTPDLAEYTRANSEVA